MEIIYKENSWIAFESLASGDVFKHCGYVCMKTDTVSDWNAILIKTGKHLCFHSTTLVEKLNCKLVIE
jgi:hypothetical protein